MNARETMMAGHIRAWPTCPTCWLGFFTGMVRLGTTR